MSYQRDLRQTRTVRADDKQRLPVVEQDGGPIRRPAPPVLPERKAPRGDPPQAAAIHIDDEECHVRLGGAARIDAVEHEPLAVRRVVARDVFATRIGRDPPQAAPVGYPDGVDAVAAGVGHAEALAEQSRAVRRPAGAAGGFEGGIGELELAEASGVGIHDRRRAVLLAVGAGGKDRDLAAVRRPARAPREPREELLHVAAVRIHRVGHRLVILDVPAERDPAVSAGDLRLGRRRWEGYAGTHHDGREPFHQTPHGGSFQFARVGRNPGSSVLTRTLTPLRWTLVLARGQLGSICGPKHPRWLQALVVAGHSSHPAERCTVPGLAMLSAPEELPIATIGAGHSVCPGGLWDAPGRRHPSWRPGALSARRETQPILVQGL